MMDRRASQIAFHTPAPVPLRYARILTSRRGRHAPKACSESLPPTEPRVSSPSRKRPYGYWKRRENIHAELLAFVREHSQQPLMPTQTELIEAGRVDLAGAIRRHGSWKKVADEVGLVLSSIAKPRGLNLIYCTKWKLRSGRMRPYMYWRNFDNLRCELIDVIRELRGGDGREDRKGVIPSASQLESAGRSDLARAIRMHGGWSAVAERLEMDARFRTKAYWNDFSHVEDEVRRIISEHITTSDSETMPSLALLKEYGKPGLYNAVVRRFGGAAKVAKRMGLATARKPRGYWSRENMKREVLRCVERICKRNPDRDPSLMPTKSELRNIGRQEVYSAVERMGGMHHIGAQIGLKCNSPPPNRGNWDVLSGAGTNTIARKRR